MIYNNHVANEGGAGIACEISHYCTIYDNIVVNNGFWNKAWGWGQGITIEETDHATVYGNIATGNYIGIGGVQQSRGTSPVTGELYEIANYDGHNNVVTLTASGQMAAGFWTDDNDTSIYTSNNNQYENETYNGLGNNSTPFEWNMESYDVSQWIMMGNDTTASFNN